MTRQRRNGLLGVITALLLSACATPPTQADNIYISTMISGELMPGIYGQVNIGTVPDYVTIYDQPVIVVQPAYGTAMQPVYLYVPPYHAHHWRDHCGFYNACARPVIFVCARDYRPHYFQPHYYNARVYNPPRVYRHSPPVHYHSRPHTTMHEREMQRDAHYYRTDDKKRPYYRPDERDDRQHGLRQRNDQPQPYYRAEPRRDDFRGSNRQQQATPAARTDNVVRMPGSETRNTPRQHNFNDARPASRSQDNRVIVNQPKAVNNWNTARQPAQPAHQPALRQQQGPEVRNFSRQGGAQPLRGPEQRR